MIFSLSDVILNVILSLFPFFVYFIYICYSSLKDSVRYNKLILNICLISSLYLLFNYGGSSNLVLLFVNIPFIIALMKKEIFVSFILSILIVYLTVNIFGVNILIQIFKFFSFYLVYLLYLKNKIKNEYKFIELMAMLEAFFISFEFILKYNSTCLLNIFEMFLVVYIFYLIPFSILYLFKCIEMITSLYKSSIEMERDKQLKNSLFKITHEVKNPIAVCKGYLDMLDTNDTYKVKKYIPIIKDEINRSLNILTDFMEFSKIKLNKDILDINMLVSEVSDEMRIICDNRIKLNYAETDDEVYVNGDYYRLKQVLINMIKNSIESISKEGIIDIRSYNKNNNYYLEIKDNGIGMDKETLSRISELFFTTKVRGSGLGVSLSQEIIKAHNGNIKYESTLNKGTKVIIKLPIYSC